MVINKALKKFGHVYIYLERFTIKGEKFFNNIKWWENKT